MCVSFCHLRRVLFWNHEDCDPRDCPAAVRPHGSCATCRHGREGMCALTHAPQPADGGCCHHDVEVVGQLEISWHMLAPLRIRPEEMVEQFLQDYDVPYQHGPQSQVLVAPDDLSLPRTYGIGTESLAEEEMDWSEWAGQWRLDDVPLVEETLSGEFPR
jgi:hypothetical protein